MLENLNHSERNLILGYLKQILNRKTCKMTLAELLEVSGVSHSTFYRQFNSMEDLSERVFTVFVSEYYPVISGYFHSQIRYQSVMEQFLKEYRPYYQALMILGKYKYGKQFSFYPLIRAYQFSRNESNLPLACFATEMLVYLFPESSIPKEAKVASFRTKMMEELHV